jgi:hypothetical protein
MAGECGKMPANHECCKTASISSQPAVSNKVPASSAPHGVVETLMITEPAVLAKRAVEFREDLFDPSPPPIPLSVLRI